MKIRNLTKYRTDDLRKFMYWVAKQEGYESSYTKRLRVTVVPARRWHTGEAPLGGSSIFIRIPKPDRLNKPRLAALVAHEMRHNHQRRGTTYVAYSTERNMRGSGRYSGRGESPERYWPEAETLELRLVEPKAKKVKTPHDRAEEGRAKAAKKVVEYERKMKRMENLLKKWRKKLRYYEKRCEVTKDLLAPEPRKPSRPEPRKKEEPVYEDTWTCLAHMDEGRVFECPYDSLADAKQRPYPCVDAEEPKVPRGYLGVTEEEPCRGRGLPTG